MIRRILLPVLFLGLSGCGDDRIANPSAPPIDPARTPTDGGAQIPSGIPFRPNDRTVVLIRDPFDAPAVPGQAVITLGLDDDETTFNQSWGTTTLETIEPGVSFLAQLPAGTEPRDLAPAMIESGECDWAEPNYLSETPEGTRGTIPFYEADHVFGDVADQGALDRIGAPLAQQTATGVGVTVAVLDTGIDSTHPDLTASVSAGGWDFVDNDADAADERSLLDEDGDGLFDEGAGHGTHVAGLVLAVAPDVTLLPVRVLNSEGVGTSVGLAFGIRWAMNSGADIINLSLGMYADSRVVKDAIDEALDAGVIVVNSAGNQGVNDRDHFPARMSDVISVAASDSLDSRASFSNFGSHVNITAPGVDLLSTFLDGGYAIWSGTSMAAPLVSGSAALRLEVNPSMTLSSLEEAIEDTATPLFGEEGSFWEGKMGDGLISVSGLVTYP